LFPWQTTKLLSTGAELLEKAQEVVKKPNESFSLVGVYGQAVPVVAER
jgi:hypothetical protein